MNELTPQIVAIDFSDKVILDPEPFDYDSNVLYNLSVPLLSNLLSLSRLPKPDNLALFKSLLKQEIVNLSEKAQAHDYPSAVIDKLCCLHCIVLDEFIIHGAWGADAGWENNTLLSELFGLKNGGDLFFTVAEKAMRKSTKMTDLLTLVYTFLQIGFKGRYRSRQSEQIGIITKAIKAIITEQITPSELLLVDSPQIKSLRLKYGARYFSFTLIIATTLILIFAFFDYWFKETYALRAKELTELKSVTANYILNTKSKDIIYVSTPEDIHAIKNLTQNDTTKSQTTSSSVAAANKESGDLQKFRVQLASFSNKKNAQTYLSTLTNSQFAVAVTKLNEYFVVYSSANSKAAAMEQRQYFQEHYQLSALVTELNQTGKSI